MDKQRIKIGFIGLGAMGLPMASNLVKAGYEVLACDLREENVKNLAVKGGVACIDNAQVAAGSDLVITSLPNAKIVASIMCGPGGIFENCRPGTMIMDMSTVAPADTRQMAGLAAERGLTYIDAPVSGGVSGATEGTLTIMVGCEEAALPLVMPVLQILGKHIFHMGGTGTGNAIKIVNNLLLGANMAALAEALVLGRKLGLTAQTMQKVIGVSSGRSYALETRLEKIILADAYDGGFAVDLQYKDLNLALEAAGHVSAPLPMTSAAVQLYQAARAMGLNRNDIGAVVKVWEELGDITIRTGDDPVL